MLIFDVLHDKLRRFECLVTQFATIFATFKHFFSLIDTVFLLHGFQELVL